MNSHAEADLLVQKIKHLLLTSSGHTLADATIEEIYRSFCLALREEIMVNSAATIATMQRERPRMVNFISMEYMPGRLLGNNIANLGANELIQAVIRKIGRNLSEIISCEHDPGLGNGGLGRLSSCFLDSLATLNYPARAYGLRYQYGIFEQEVRNGIQIERPDCWLLYENPWESRRDLFSVGISFREDPIEEVRAIPFDIPIIGYSSLPNYSVLLLRLWSTKESPRNFELQHFNAGFLDQASENTSLTDVLYPNDNNELGKRVRLKQEFVLVSASLQDIIRRHLQLYGSLDSLADQARIQLNDTHPALMIAELVRTLTKDYDFSWEKAWETCQSCCSYTNHTILREALEEWNEKRVHELLPRQYEIIQKLNLDFCDQIRKKYPGDEERVRTLSIIEAGQIRMAHLAIYGSHKVNGVAKLHSQILQQTTFKEFAEMFPEKFTNVTNGVTQRRWLLHANPLLAAFITKRIGSGWITHFSEIQQLAPFAKDLESQSQFLEVKKQNKEALLSFLSHEVPLTALFDVQIKRIHEYKRQLLNALHLIMLYQEPQKRKISRFSIFAGKAAPGYERAKQIIRLISAIGRKFRAERREDLSVLFVENYNVSRAEMIIPAADLSEQISTAGWEASGTGNMKLTLNGALTIGTEDGANVEMHQSVTDRFWPFAFGASAQENLKSYHPHEIYNQDEAIRNALDSLNDGTFAQTEEEAQAFHQIYQSLLNLDTFRVLQDLRSYFDAQKKVEELFLSPNRWAETAIQNIAAMGPFSTDTSIRNYAKNIWGIEPCPTDPSLLEKIRAEYA